MHRESGDSNCRLTMTETHPNKYETRLKDWKKERKFIKHFLAFLLSKKERKERKEINNWIRLSGRTVEVRYRVQERRIEKKERLIKVLTKNKQIQKKSERYQERKQT
jgi:hypothetical protein